jgi:hypothetical protein
MYHIYHDRLDESKPCTNRLGLDIVLVVLLVLVVLVVLVVNLLVMRGSLSCADSQLGNERILL